MSRYHLHAKYRDYIEAGTVIKTPSLGNKSLPRSAIRHLGIMRNECIRVDFPN